MKAINDYLMSDGLKYNIGRILMDAGISNVGSWTIRQIEAGEVVLSPEVNALYTEAQRRNAALEQRQEQVDTSKTFSNEFVSEWESRGSRTGE